MRWGNTRWLVGLLVACNLIAFLAMGWVANRSFAQASLDEGQAEALSHAVDLAQQYRNGMNLQVTALRDYLISGEQAYLHEHDAVSAKRQAIAAELQAIQEVAKLGMVSDMEAQGKRFMAYRQKTEGLPQRSEDRLRTRALLQESRGILSAWREGQYRLLEGLRGLQLERATRHDQALSTGRQFAVLATSGALLVALALALILVLRVLRPLQDLGRAAEGLARGEAGVRVKVQGQDEFAQVGRAFNTMAEAVEASLNRLQAANEELRGLDRAKDEFLSVTSHELRTPLGFIKGFAGLLEAQMAGPLEEEQRRYAGHIVSNADRMLALVKDLLDLATIRAGKLNIHRSPEPLHQIVAEAVAEAVPAAQAKGLRLQMTQTEVAITWVDPMRVHQILTNLLGNAIKFTPPGGAIQVRLEAEGGGWHLAVQDSGPGVPPEAQGKLFQRFSQVDMADTRLAGGSGLGLYICKALVEAHGGHIGLSSPPEGGACFWVKLPAQAEEPSQTWPPDLSPPLERAPSGGPEAGPQAALLPG